MTQPSPSPQSPAAPRDDPTTDTDLTAIAAQQLILLSTQATLVRYLEDTLTISPPGPTPPVPAPPAGTDLDQLVDSQGAAIRSQAAYINHLQDIVALVGPEPASQPTKQ